MISTRPERLRPRLAFLLFALWLPVLAALSVRSAQALDPRKAITQYGHVAWTADAGLPQNSVICLAQTDDGYLWMGTQEGLARFDGVRFKVFDPKNSTFPDIFVSSLLKDRDGTLWIGTQGAGLTHYANGSFRVYTTREGLPHNYAYVLYQDHAGSLWIGTQGGGLAKLENGRFVTYGVPEGLVDKIVWAITEDHEGSLWIGTNHGLTRFQSGQFRTWTVRDGLPSDIIRTLFTDKDGVLWVGTESGLVTRKDGAWISYTTASGLPSNRISVIYQDRAGTLWFGTDGGGLVRRRSGQFETFTTKEGLSSDLVLSIFEDREGSLWIGSTGGGVDQLRDTKFTTYTTREGLPQDVVRSIFQDRSGTLWIGTGGAGLASLKEGQVSTYAAREGLLNGLVRALFQDEQGRLWIGTHGGLAELSRGRIRTYSVAQGLSNPIVYALAGDRNGNLWIGTEGGLNRFRDGSFQTYTTADGLPHDVIRVLHTDQKGNLWIGTRGGGLSCFRNGRFVTYTTKDGLGSNVVLEIHEDAEGALWIGTGGGGLSELQDGKFRTFTSRDGLFDDVIMRILEDSQANLWMTCNKGVFRVAKSQLRDLSGGRRKRVQSISFGKSDGMLSRECNGGSQPAGWQTQDGHLWFPTLKGAVSIDPNDIPINRERPPVIIEEFLVNNSSLPIKGRIRLPPGNNKLEFRYTALSFLAPELVRFRYQLERFDRNWVDAAARRIAYYTNVPAGRYRFRVLACNNDGIWSPVGASLDFEQSPFFYNTIWFYALVLTTTVLLGAGSYRLHIRHLKTRQEELARLVEERTLELESANKELQRLSTVDALTGVANRRRCDQSLQEQWRRTYRSGSALSAILFDIDFFKSFNDHYGHQRGDECLRQIAEAAAKCAKRTGDLAGRYGGEEFLLLLPETEAPGALVVAEALQCGIEALRIPHEYSEVAKIVTVSIGVATIYPRDGLPPDQLLSAADAALYRAKNEGRQRIVQAAALDAVPKAPKQDTPG